MKYKRGDWVSIEYGFNRCRVYILQYSEESNVVEWCKPSWMASDANTMTIKEFQFHEPLFLGHGKERLWRKYLPIIKDSICPFSKEEQ